MVQWTSSPVVPANVPARLRKLPRWVAWRYERKPGTEKLSKVPYSTVGKHPRKIDATKIENGVPYAAALVALRDKAKRLDGVGIILGDGLAGIDVDDCIDADGNMDERGQRISERFRSSYAEVSPSGRGFKVFIDVGDDAELAAVGENTRELEIYGSKRYFTVTGQRLPGHPTSIASMAGEFRATAIEVDALRGAPKSDAHDDAGGGRWAHRKNLTREQVEAALATISADCSNGDWFDYGRAIELQFGDEGFDIWNDWSATSATQYPGEADCRKEWARYKRDNDELTTSDRPKTVASIVSDASTHASPVKPVAEQTFVLTSARELMEMEMDSNYSTALGVACPVGVVVTAGLGGSGKSTIAATLVH